MSDCHCFHCQFFLLCKSHFAAYSSFPLFISQILVYIELRTAITKLKTKHVFGLMSRLCWIFFCLYVNMYTKTDDHAVSSDFQWNPSMLSKCILQQIVSVLWLNNKTIIIFWMIMLMCLSKIRWMKPNRNERVSTNVKYPSLFGGAQILTENRKTECDRDRVDIYVYRVTPISS